MVGLSRYPPGQPTASSVRSPTTAVTGNPCRFASRLSTSIFSQRDTPGGSVERTISSKRRSTAGAHRGDRIGVTDHALYLDAGGPESVCCLTEPLLGCPVGAAFGPGGLTSRMCCRHEQRDLGGSVTDALGHHVEERLAARRLVGDHQDASNLHVHHLRPPVGASPRREAMNSVVEALDWLRMLARTEAHR